MQLSNVFYLMFGAIITIMVEYFLVSIKETRETKRVMEIINAELMKNKEKSSKIKSKISQSNANTFGNDLIDLQKEIKQNPFLFFGKEILKNKFSTLRIDADYFIDVTIIYQDLKDLDSYILSYPGSHHAGQVKTIKEYIINKVEICNMKISKKIDCSIKINNNSEKLNWLKHIFWLFLIQT